MVMLPFALETYRYEIDSEMKSIIGGRQSPLYDMMRYHLGWVDETGNPLDVPSGKALRPTLCLLTCEAVCGDYHRALPAAAAIELVHNYSLIHDDIQDDDRERRHRPTVWSIWGKPQAINAGTAMRMLANIALMRLDERGIPVEKRMRIQQLLDETTLRLLEGQYLDISFENRPNIRVADYLEMIEGKTAALIACSMEAGAVLGDGDEPLIVSLRSVGWNLGMAFQIKDDALGIWGDSEKTGKPLGSDIRRRKKTLPVIYTMENSRNGVNELLMKAYRTRNVSESDVNAILQALEDTGAQDQAQEMVEQYCNRASEEIAILDLPHSAKKDLHEIVSFLTERNF